MFGNLDKWPAIHVFGIVQDQNVQPDAIRNLGFGQKGGSWTTPENTKAAQTLVDWVNKGYLPRTSTARATTRRGRRSPRARASSSSPAPGCRPTSARPWATRWLHAAAVGAPATRPPPAAPASRWRSPSKSEHPDAAAAYINFITSPNAMAVIAKTGNLPVADTAEQEATARSARRSSTPSARRCRRTPWCPTSTTRRRPATTRSAPRCRTCWRRRRHPSSSSTPLRRTTAGSSPRTE